MGGHRVLRDFQPSSDFASGKALGLMLHKEPEGFKAGALRQGGENFYCVTGFHISTNIDALGEVKPARVLVAAYEAYRRAPTDFTSSPSTPTRREAGLDRDLGPGPPVPMFDDATGSAVSLVPAKTRTAFILIFHMKQALRVTAIRLKAIRCSRKRWGSSI